MRPSVSLCMICKDGGRTLRRCLTSAREMVDEIIFVDTGSSDDSVEIAGEFHSTVLSVPWRDDYSAARNFGLRSVRTDWILVLDADEILHVGEHGLDRLLAEIAAHSVPIRNVVRGSTVDYLREEAGNFEIDSDGSTFFLTRAVRLFPAGRKVEFAGAVHESVLVSCENAGLSIRDVDDCYIEHILGEMGALRARANRYGQIAKDTLALDPDDWSARRTLGLSYARDEQFDRAEPLLRACYLDRPTDEMTMFGLAVALCGLERFDCALQLSKQASSVDAVLMIYASARINWRMGRLEEAYTAICEAAARAPRRPEFWLQRSMMEASLGKVHEANASLRKLQALLGHTRQMDEILIAIDEMGKARRATHRD